MLQPWSKNLTNLKSSYNWKKMTGVSMGIVNQDNFQKESTVFAFGRW